MAQSGADKKPRASYLERLSIVFADPLRLKIVTELHMRPMSATQFFRTFGGGSVQRVERHFKKLAAFDWIQLANTERGGQRRGANEHFYVAAELAVFDLDTWSQLPYSIRAEFSQRIFQQFADRVRDAIEAKTFDARSERHFSWTPVVLDLTGWHRVIGDVDAVFESLFVEQDQATNRLRKSKGEGVLVTTGLAVFESPGHTGEEGRWAGLPAKTSKAEETTTARAPDPSTHRLAKVFGDPLNLKIVTELNLRPMSPTQFWREFGGSSKQELARRFKMLAALNWLMKVDEKSGGRRRGATEHFYRATGPAIFDNPAWSEVPQQLRLDFSWRIFEQLAEQVHASMGAGILDARPERHLTWTLLRLDQRGWQRVVTSLNGVFDSLFVEEKQARLRLAEGPTEQIRATVALAAFESPSKDQPRAP